MLQQPTPSFGHLIAATLEQKGVSQAEATRAMGLRSKTTLHRILNDASSYETTARFYRSFLNQFPLEPAEQEALETALEIRRVGVQAHRSHQAMWRFLQNQQSPAAEIPLEGCGEWANLSQMLESCFQGASLSILVLNAAKALPPLIRLLEQHPQARVTVEHWLFIDEDAARTTEYVQAAFPLIFDRRYCAHTLYCDQIPDESGGLFRGNGMAVRVQPAEGQAWQAQVVFSGGLGHVMRAPGQEGGFLSFWQSVLAKYRPAARPLKAEMPLRESINDYIAVVQRYREIEENQAIFNLKADLCVVMVPAEIQLAAMLDGLAALGMDANAPAVQAAIQRLYQVQAARYANYCVKQKTTCIISTQDALRSFFRTGRHASHLVFMRPYTPAERRVILQHLLSMEEDNPYFNLYLLINPRHIPAMEIICSEGNGVIFSRPNPPYRPGEDHVEAVITQREFVQTLCDFFCREFLERHVLPSQDSKAFLQELMGEIPEEAPDDAPSAPGTGQSATAPGAPNSAC